MKNNRLGSNQKEELKLGGFAGGLIIATTPQEINLAESLKRKKLVSRDSKGAHGFRRTYHLTIDGRRILRQVASERSRGIYRNPK